MNDSPSILLIGEHLLGDQIHNTFAHENIKTIVLSHKEIPERSLRNIPAIVWTTNNRQALSTAIKLRRLGCQPHRYWIGGDALRLSQTRGIKKYTLSNINKILYKSHTANSDWLKEELKGCGIEAHSTPFSPVCCGEHWPLTEARIGTYTIIFYSHEDNDHIYLPEKMIEAASRLPNCLFLCLGDPNLKTNLPNIKNLGAIPPAEMHSIYQRAHCLLRVTSHDGFPRMVIEAMANGLDVVCNLPIPKTLQADSVDEIVSTIGQLASLPRNRNKDGREWILSHHSAASWTEYWRSTLLSA